MLSAAAGKHPPACPSAPRLWQGPSTDIIVSAVLCFAAQIDPLLRAWHTACDLYTPSSADHPAQQACAATAAAFTSNDGASPSGPAPLDTTPLTHRTPLRLPSPRWRSGPPSQTEWRRRQWTGCRSWSRTGRRRAAPLARGKSGTPCPGLLQWLLLQGPWQWCP